MRDPEPHDYGCRCERCRAMATAITVQNPDGTYFYTDEELHALAMQDARVQGKDSRKIGQNRPDSDLRRSGR
jgi:hypothetical protein